MEAAALGAALAPLPRNAGLAAPLGRRGLASRKARDHATVGGWPYGCKLSRKVVRRGIFPSTKALIEAIMAFIKRYNEEGRPFRWTCTPDRFKLTSTNRTEH